MGLHEYRFRSVWRLPAPPEAVYAVLTDVGGYGSWWPQVRAVSKIDDECAEFVCRSVLPYDLVFRARQHTRDEQAGVLRARLTGDLDGFCGWTLTAKDTGTSLLFQQVVQVTKPLLRAIAPLARPVLRGNHAVMMRSGRIGLTRYLCRCRRH